MIVIAMLTFYNHYCNDNNNRVNNRRLQLFCIETNNVKYFVFLLFSVKNASVQLCGLRTELSGTAGVTSAATTVHPSGIRRLRGHDDDNFRMRVRDLHPVRTVLRQQQAHR